MNFSAIHWGQNGQPLSTNILQERSLIRQNNGLDVPCEDQFNQANFTCYDENLVPIKCWLFYLYIGLTTNQKESETTNSPCPIHNSTASSPGPKNNSSSALPSSNAYLTPIMLAVTASTSIVLTWKTDLLPAWVIKLKDCSGLGKKKMKGEKKQQPVPFCTILLLSLVS